ncbi:MAG: fibronectin type III domain-containing protein [Treponema sp.]|nr:fibronectin type III domain-containing protein [Treponema sp.]
MSEKLGAADRRRARAGQGAALFSGEQGAGKTGPLVVEARDRDALFAAGGRIGDFSLEFWLYPFNMENGERILSWVAVTPGGQAAGDAGSSLPGEPVYQFIRCTAARNRLRWDFDGFFTSPSGTRRLDLRLDGGGPLVPKTWSHHLIRFDADTGLLEYLVNGKAEVIEYASPTGGEGGEVYTPLVGEGGSFVLGGQFKGLMDEFALWKGREEPRLSRYAPEGGRLVTSVVDMGEGNSGVLRIDASGGSASVSGGNVTGEYAVKGSFRFDDDSELRFFLRTADSPYRWREADWRPVTPGADLPDIFRGRYAQLAVDFYPSGDGEASPYLEEVRLVYRPDEPPLPPPRISAAAGDGAVQLDWRPGPDTDIQGYLVYYGTVKGEYFGEDAIQGSSPIDAGTRTALRIEGLKNGVLYYFAVAAYDRKGAGNEGPYHAGEFSREVSARPLRMAE